MTDHTRRDSLIKLAAAIGSAALLPAQSPNDTIRVAFIGVGNRGSSLLKNMLKVPGVKVVAICDIDPERLKAAQAAAGGADGLEETEFLKLIHRYLSQARELDQLAGPEKVIRVAACESAITGDLLRVLGFRMRGGCGAEVVLETVNAPRAFITTDSGFPVAELEQAQ